MIKGCPFRCGWELEYSVAWEGHAEIELRDHLDEAHPGWPTQLLQGEAGQLIYVPNLPGARSIREAAPDWLPAEYPGDSPPLIVPWLLAHPDKGLEGDDTPTAAPTRSRVGRAGELLLALVMTASMVWLSLKLLGVI